MIENVLSLLTLAVPLMASPGPATVSLAATGSAFGVRFGVPYLGGIVLGNSAVLLMIATGITGLILALPAAIPVLTTVGLAYLLYLAWKIATAPIIRGDAVAGTAPTLGGGFLLALANPKAYAAIGAVYASGSILPADPFLDTALKLTVLTGVNLVGSMTWLVIGALFSGLLRNPRTGRILNLSFAVLLMVSVAVALIR